MSYKLHFRAGTLIFCYLIFNFYQSVVIGYSYSTVDCNNCAGCHSLRKSGSKPGTWAIRKDKVRRLWKSGEPLCDVCHTDKRDGFCGSDTGTVYPSSHPVAVFGRDSDDPAFAGRNVIFCTNCHDPVQTGRGVHSEYVSIFRLRSVDLGYGDPDPPGDTIHVSDYTRQTGWFSKKSFDARYDSDVILFGKIDHQGDSTFNPKNSREANKERIDFDTLGLRGVYFCLTCHDNNGFPLNPTNPSDTLRIHPTDLATYYNYSDGNDSVWSPQDGGHTIRGESTNTGLKRGDKLPCVDCHSSHSSSMNNKLLRDSFIDTSFMAIGFRLDTSGAGEVRISRNYCLKCHTGLTSSSFYNRYYNNGQYFKFNDTASSYMAAPAVGKSGQNISGHTAAGELLYPSCYAFKRGANYLGGCHGDPHSTPVFCNGCHKDHAYYYDSVVGGNVSHPVGIELPKTINPAETISIYDYYNKYADTVEVRLINNKIDCLTCHNEHSGNNTLVTDSTDRQMQAMLRGDSGPLLPVDTAKIPAGINNYPEHNTNYNMALETLTISGGMSVNDFRNMKAMPELCINCHNRIVGFRNNHGGFSAGGFGFCDKCHSMHGRHREPAEGSNIDSTTLVYPLHYGMFSEYNNLNYTNNEVYQTAIDGILKRVYQDTSGMFYSYYQGNHLIHVDAEKQQMKLCQRCHGSDNWVNIVDVSDTAQAAPPQILYDTGQREDSADTYYTDVPFNSTNRNRTVHPVDLTVQPVPGNSIYWNISISCSSGTNGAGCHNPHGNNNYAQLNEFVKIGGQNSPSLLGLANVLYKGGGTNAKYVSGMNTYCSLCHDLFAGYIYDSTSYESAKGHYTYTRHPTGKKVSLLNLYPNPSMRTLIDSTFFNKLILDYDSGKYPVVARNSTDPYPYLPSYQDFLNAPASDSTDNFIVTCVTCHYPHGSKFLHLRKFLDTAVIECVGCHSESPDIIRYW